MEVGRLTEGEGGGEEEEEEGVLLWVGESFEGLCMVGYYTYYREDKQARRCL